jgi:hypothetical protein
VTISSPSRLASVALRRTNERLTPQVISVQFDQIESIEENGFVVQPTKSLDLS